MTPRRRNRKKNTPHAEKNAAVLVGRFLRVAIEDPAHQEQPEQQVAGRHHGNGRGQLPVVEHARDVVEHGAEPHDSRREGAAQARRARAELLPPLGVHAGGRRVGRQALTEALREQAAHHDGGRERDEQGQQEHPAKNGRRAGHAPHAVSKGRKDLLHRARCIRGRRRRSRARPGAIPATSPSTSEWRRRRRAGASGCCW